MHQSLRTLGWKRIRSEMSHVESGSKRLGGGNAWHYVVPFPVKMASAYWLRKLPEFFIARFPFLNAISLLLLLAERAQNER